MSPSRADIAQLISSFDHPDAIRQRELMDRLLAMLRDDTIGAEVLETSLANLKMVEPAARVALLRVLGEFGHPDTLLPLMRFVFDQRGKPQESDARGLAMQGIMRLTNPDRAARVFDFLMDVKHDEDPFVRGYAAQAFEQIGDRRAIPILEGMLEQDGHEFVRESAARALERLRSAAQGEQSSSALSQADISAQELLQKIRGAQGKDRDYWLGILRERQDSFELLAELISNGATKKDRLVGLRQLLDHPDPRTRQLALAHMRHTRDTSERAICLRILGNHLEGDATADELEQIRAARRDQDLFVQRAALRAAAASGNEDLIQHAIEHLMKRDESARSEAASGLARSGGDALKRHQPRLRDALERAHNARLHSASDELELIEANLLQALSSFAGRSTIGRKDLQRDALRSLRMASGRWPILVSALKLLRESAGDMEDWGPEQRWSGAEAAPLLDLISHENAKVRQRAFAFLHQGAPLKWSVMTPYLEQLLHDEKAPVVEHIIPLLEQTQDARALELLEDLSRAPDSATSEAARGALQRIRNTHRVVDANFVKPDDFF